MATTVQVGVILASVREGRRGEAFARWIHALLTERPDVEAHLLDLRDWPFPAYAHAESPNVAEKGYAPDSLEGRWGDTIAALHAFVVVTPEYNHGYPGGLKNALDQVYKPWNFKPVGFLSYGGSAAGTRATEQLRGVAIELRMAPIRDEVNLRLAGLQVDARGWPADPFSPRRAAAMLDDLLWWSRVLLEGRLAHPR